MLHPELARFYRYISPKVPFDYLSDDNPEYPLQLRIVRFKISEEIKQLYHLRWGIELSFRDLKQTLAAEQFHCKTREYIGMELYARMILYNFCSIITAQVVIDQKNRTYVYQINGSMAIKICHKFLTRGRESPIPVECLIGSFLLPIRPGRIYERRKRLQPPARFVYRSI